MIKRKEVGRGSSSGLESEARKALTHAVEELCEILKAAGATHDECVSIAQLGAQLGQAAFPKEIQETGDVQGARTRLYDRVTEILDAIQALDMTDWYILVRQRDTVLARSGRLHQLARAGSFFGWL